MSDSESSTDQIPELSLKVAINKQKSKVLFAEAGSDFVDVLLSFLTLPLAKIINILEDHFGSNAPIVGSLTSLYRSVSNLDGSHFCVEGAKQILLNPRSWREAEWRRLKLDVTDPQPAKYFICESEYECGYISMYCDVAECGTCGGLLDMSLYSGDDYPDEDDDGGVFMKKESTFVVTDDLRVVPVESGFLQTIERLGIADADEAELICLSFGIDDIKELLKLSLISSTPLTDLIFKIRVRQRCTTAAANLFHLPKNDDEAANSRKMIMHATLHKSTNRFLFAKVSDDFVEFLFSFLTFPLGGIEHLLRGQTSVKPIDNMYHAVDLCGGIDHKFFRSHCTRFCLMIPKLAHGYASESRILPLGEDDPPRIYYMPAQLNSLNSFRWSKGPGRFVKEEERAYIVSDDLTVIPHSVSSSMSILDNFGIPLSDVRETELHIGLQEALSIVKASLTSKTAMTDALLMKKVPKLQHQPKQEP